MKRVEGDAGRVLLLEATSPSSRQISAWLTEAASRNGRPVTRAQTWLALASVAGQPWAWYRASSIDPVADAQLDPHQASALQAPRFAAGVGVPAEGRRTCTSAGARLHRLPYARPGVMRLSVVTGRTPRDPFN